VERALVNATSRPAVLLAGGTDPSGGAGLAADIKAASAAGAQVCIAVTAITVQNSGEVRSWTAAAPGLVYGQIEAVADDCDIRAVKSGMLGSPSAAGELRQALDNLLPGVPYVLDPVLAAGSGDSLSARGMAESIAELLVPACALCTPNLDEASALSGIEVRTRSDMLRAGREILDRGAGAVLVKGGHLEGPPTDVLVTRTGSLEFDGERLVPGKVHGTGCTLASAIAARLCLGIPLVESVRASLAYLRQALLSSFPTVRGTLLGHIPPFGPRPASPDGEAFYAPPRFCTGCGSQLEGDRLPDGHLHCPRCGFVAWRNPLPAVTVVVMREGSVLLVKRSVRPRMGAWCLPGGFLELGETVEECAARELLEETGLSADRFSLLGVRTDVTEYGGIMLAALEALGTSGDLRPGDDASDAAWFRLDEVPPLAFQAHDRIVEALRSADGKGLCLTF
jgi:hydroxymethylpyrimidine/phosphomethylpyrimidine kinase